jgi:PKD repeat protein
MNTMKSFYKSVQCACWLIVCLLSYTNSFGQANPTLEKMRQDYERSMNEHKFNNRPNLSRQQWKAIPKATRPDLAMEQDFLLTKDPKLGRVPVERRVEAMERIKQILKDRIANPKARTEAAIPNVVWNERGPNNVGGSTRALMFDPNDNTHKKVWAGVAGGGMWYTNDVTVDKPTWVKVDDFWDNLAVSWIVAAPNKNDFYVGTGEGWMGGSSIDGAGIWKSSNAGANWTRLQSTNTPDFKKVLTIAVTGTGQGTVLAGTQTGMFRSTDGGMNWTQTLDVSVDPYSTRSVTDIEVASNGHIYASLGIFSAGKIVKSTDDGRTWALLPALPAQSPQRLQMAVSPTNPNLLYVAAQGSGTNTLLPNGGVFKTTDGGTSWQTIATPISGEGDGKDGASQAWIHLTLAIDPTNDNHVILGGLDLFRSTNGGMNWTPISKWSNNGNLANLTCSTVHADQTNTLFVPGSSTSVLFGNDGGVYYTTNIANAATNDVIKERNNGYNVTQFYAGAINPTANSNNFLGGAQDNGTQRFTQAGVGSTTEATGGDGAFCFIDQDEPLIQITSYTNNNYYLSQDGGNSFPGITNNQDGSFINPADYDDRENILYSGRDANSIQRITNLGRGRKHIVSAVPLAIGSKASHFRVSSFSAAGSSTVYIGTQAGKVFKVTNAHDPNPTLIEITGDLAQTGSVSCIEIGASEDELLLTLSNYGVKSVWLSKNAGTNWVSKDEAAHGLPDIPVRWALFNPKNRNQVLIATELGVWSTDNINDANPGWQPTNAGLANTRMSMLKYRASDGVILGVSYGRGLYTTNVFAEPLADFEAQHTTWFAGKNLTLFDRSIGATSWSWDTNNDGTPDATTQNVTFNYPADGVYSVKLTINGNNNLSKTITNYITILPNPTIPYTNNFNTNGGGFTPRVLSGRGEWQYGAGTANKGNFNPAKSTATIEGAGNWMTNLNTTHNSNTRYVLESPPFSTQMLPIGDYFLSFDYRALVGTGAGFNVEYSTDAGNNWTVLGSVGDANAMNWYTTASVPGLGGASGWVQESFTIFKPSYKISAIAALMNQADVRFRFVFGAAGSQWDGVQIDNFAITAPPVTAPTVTTYAPAINTTNIARNTTLVLTFDKAVQKGNGNIIINQPIGGTQKEAINVTSQNVKIEGNTVTITLADVLTVGATAEVIVPNGTFKDLLATPNDFAGIAAGAWTFTVSSEANTPPTLNLISNSPILKEDAGEQIVTLTGISSGDGATQAVNFTATAVASDNQDLLPNGNLSVNYTNPAVTAELKYTAAQNKNGVANVTVTLTDAGGLSIARTFAVTVTKTNDPPTFAVPASAPPVEQGNETQTVEGFATGIDDGDEEEEQELNFNVNVAVDGLLVGDEVEIFDEIDIDTETGDLTYKLLPNVIGEISVRVQLFDDGEAADPTRGVETGGSDNSSNAQIFKITVALPGTLTPPVDPNNPTTTDPKKPITVLGLNDDDSKHINIYPNPNTGKFALKYEGLPTSKFLSIAIINTNGQVVYQGQRGNFVGTYEGEIDLTDVANGVYIVSIISEKTIYRKRLVLSR